MHKTIIRTLSLILLSVFLAGCSTIPGDLQNTSEAFQNIYVSQTPLKIKDTYKPTDSVISATEPFTEPVTEPATEPVTEPATEPSAEPATAPATQPATEPVTEPATDPAAAPTTEPPVTPSEGVEKEAEVLPSGSGAIPEVAKPVASGTKVKSNEEAIIDYSNTSDGYVMVQYTAVTSQRLKVQVKGPSTTYTYNLTPQQWTAFPLSDNNGDYQVVVYKNVVDTKYAAVLSLSVSVSMEDEYAPYIRSNQYVNFDAAPATVSTAAALAGGISDPLQKVAAIYNFVVHSMTYDTELAATVTSGYLPDLDSVLAKMSGICFDYAALMTGMLRSQGVPTKLIIGYAGDVYHAWINVYSSSTGWVEGIIYFDGVNWQRMDPTFASSGGSGVMDYIGNGANYSAKYIY